MLKIKIRKEMISMDNKIIVDAVIYVGLPVVGALISKSYNKIKNTKYGKTAKKIVEETEEMTDFSGTGSAGQKLKYAVAKLIEKYTCLTEDQATEIINRAVYEMNKALKK
jgi:hypothetical protein